MKIALGILAACLFAATAQAEYKRGKPHGLDRPQNTRTFTAHGFNKPQVADRAAGGLKKIEKVALPATAKPYRQSFGYASRVGREWSSYGYRGNLGKPIEAYGSNAPVGKKAEAYLSKSPVGKEASAYGSGTAEIQSGYRLQIQRP